MPEAQETQVPQCCFLILAVDFRPEVVSIDLQLPCDVDDALQRVADSRTADHAVHLDNLQPASPQPDEAFGVLLALPDWPVESAIVVIDARAVDGRLFAHAIRGRFNRQSLLAQLGIDDGLGLRVYLQGTVLDDTTWYAFQTGETIFFKLRDEPLPPPVHLDHMLLDGYEWGDHCPSYEGPHFPAFRVLSDGGQHMILVDVDRVRNFADFQQVVKDHLRLRSDQPVICSSVPRVTDLAVLGQSCKAILVASERVLRLPMPPSRLSLYTPIVFVDCRCILKGFTWLAAASGLVDLERLVASFRDDAPVGYCPEVKGAATEFHLDRPYLRVSYGTLLSVTFVLATGDSDGTSSAPSSDDSSHDVPREADSQDAASTPPAQEPPGDRRDRSRSPPARPPPPPADSLKLSLSAVSRTSPETGKHPNDRLRTQPTRLSSFLQWVPCPYDTLSVPRDVKSLGMPDLGHVYSFLTMPWAPLWDLLGQPRVCKTLCDPREVAAYPRSMIADLRRITTRLGGTWRYMPYDDDPLTDEGEDLTSEGSQTVAEPVLMHFLILAPGYKTSRVTVQALLPILVDEAIELIQQQRRPEDRLLLSIILPANPQPCPGIGVVLAVPAWWSSAQTTSCCLCLDTSAIDGRIFAALSPRYVSCRHLLNLAGLPANAEVVVHEQGSFMPLAVEGHCHVSSGDAFLFLPRGSICPTLRTLAQDLLSRRAWSPIVTAPTPPQDLHYCLVHEDETILFAPGPGEYRAYRAQIAACVGANQRTLRLFPASPQIHDSALSGFPCRAIISVCNPSSIMPVSFHGVFIDARSLFAGWRTYHAVAGRFSCIPAIVDLQRLLPAGWRVFLIGVPQHIDLVDTRPGQVFVAAVEIADGSGQLTAPVDGGQDPSSNATEPPAARGSASPSRPARTGGSPERFTSGADSALVEGLDTALPLAEEEPLHFFACTFLVLGPHYSPELVEVRLPEGVSVPEALDLVNAARSPHDTLLLPAISAVDPQPSRTHAIVLSAPAWPFHGVIVAFDCRPIGGTVFAVHLFGHLNREDLLRVAQLATDFQGEVVVGTLPWPLPRDVHVTLSHGDLVSFRPQGAGANPVHTLAHMLRSSDGWDPAFDPTNEFRLSPSHRIWIPGDHDSYSFQVLPERHRQLRLDIAQLCNVPVDRLFVQVAHLRSRDFAHRGLQARAIFVASGLQGNQIAGDSRPVACFVDARPILLTFSPLFCREGMLDIRTLVERFRPRCPAGWEVCVRRLEPERDVTARWITVIAGEVLTLLFRPAADGVTSAPPSLPGSRGDEEGDDDGDDQGTPDQGGPFSRGHNTRPSLPGVAAADTGGTPSAPAAVLQDRPSGVSSLHCIPAKHLTVTCDWTSAVRPLLCGVMWRAGYTSQDARDAGHPPFTPDALGMRLTLDNSFALLGRLLASAGCLDHGQRALQPSALRVRERAPAIYLPPHLLTILLPFVGAPGVRRMSAYRLQTACYVQLQAALEEDLVTFLSLGRLVQGFQQGLAPAATIPRRDMRVRPRLH